MLSHEPSPVLRVRLQTLLSTLLPNRGSFSLFTMMPSFPTHFYLLTTCQSTIRKSKGRKHTASYSIQHSLLPSPHILPKPTRRIAPYSEAVGSRIHEAKEDDPWRSEEFERVFELFSDKSKAIIEDTEDVNLGTHPKKPKISASLSLGKIRRIPKKEQTLPFLLGHMKTRHARPRHRSGCSSSTVVSGCQAC